MEEPRATAIVATLIPSESVHCPTERANDITRRQRRGSHNSACAPSNGLLFRPNLPRRSARFSDAVHPPFVGLPCLFRGDLDRGLGRPEVDCLGSLEHADHIAIFRIHHWKGARRRQLSWVCFKQLEGGKLRCPGLLQQSLQPVPHNFHFLHVGFSGFPRSSVTCLTNRWLVPCGGSCGVQLRPQAALDPSQTVQLCFRSLQERVDSRKLLGYRRNQRLFHRLGLANPC
mmetsp:Transcript_33831/g.87995  ORF Transcript_33831/g.87995 Transcript_33831/m.87995 type:complete len:229 (+) Transcript_33831:591-1277(+)